MEIFLLGIVTLLTSGTERAIAGVLPSSLPAATCHHNFRHVFGFYVWPRPHDSNISYEAVASVALMVATYASAVSAKTTFLFPYASAVSAKTTFLFPVTFNFYSLVVRFPFKICSYSFQSVRSPCTFSDHFESFLYSFRVRDQLLLVVVDDFYI